LVDVYPNVNLTFLKVEIFVQGMIYTHLYETMPCRSLESHR